MAYARFSFAEVQGMASSPCAEVQHVITNDLWKRVVKEYIIRDIISLDEVVGLEEEAIINKIIKKVHPYAISQTTSGRWITYVADSKKSSGRRQISKKSKAQLEAFLLEYYAIPEKASHVVYFSELFQENIGYKKKFLNVSNRRKGISPTTIRRYERDYDNYIARSELDNSEIAQITTISLELMLVKIIEAHDLSEKCASNMLSYVCQAFKFAVRNRYLENDPSEFIDRRLILSRCRVRPIKDDSERVLTFKELTALRQAVLKHEAEYPDYIADYAIELAMLTGMRVGNRYVIPSSLHEVLLVEHDTDPNNYLEMVKDVNRTVVDSEDILSDSVYEITVDGLSIAVSAA